MDKRKAIPLLIVAVGLLAYGNTFNVPFIFDDRTAFEYNPHLHRLWPPWEAMQWPRGSTLSGRPVVCFSVALNYAISGMEVWSYHAFNLLVHIVNALLLYGIIRRTFARINASALCAARSTLLAAAVALLWLSHPLQTEAVTYMIQRTELLVALFLLLMLYCVIRSADSPRRGWWQFAAVISCALGMGSKEVMAVAPVLVLLYDRIFLSVSWQAVFQQRRRLHEGLALTWLILIVIMAASPRSASAGIGIGISPFNYALTQAGVIVHYLRLSLWPAPLAFDYWGWPIAQTAGDVTVALAMVATVLSATMWALIRKPRIGFLGAWFFLILAPSSSFIPIVTEIVAERRMYLPLASVVTLVVVGSHWALSAVAQRFSWNEKIAQQLGVFALILLVGLMTVATVRRNYDYRSEIAIWQDTVRKRPDNARAFVHLGAAWQKVGEIDKAIENFRRALELDPRQPQARNNLGLLFDKQGKTDDAIRMFREEIEINPMNEMAYHNLAVLLERKGNREEATQYYRAALQIRPEYAEAHNHYGAHLANQGQHDNAIAHYQTALRLRPNYAEAHLNLGVSLEAMSKPAEALAHFRAAVSVRPDYAEAHYNLGFVLARQGNLDESQKHLQEALRLRPDDADTHYQLGLVMSLNGREIIALSHWREAVRLRPDWPVPLNRLARLLATSPNHDIRDGAEAVRLAEQACALTHHLQPQFLDTLAAAYAEAGRFDEAVKTTESALELATRQHDFSLVNMLKKREELYRAQRPLRELTVPQASK